ncbi:MULTISPECIES: hypothetical protein [Oenococcus]|uniref:Uncharacterized protein n=1 Tax=Oenococcus kitaharae DSM 17330 TaxID=1045004 RepID=G9WJ64_9LACO|nr:hypothetical protein [Oenococcus kitaharae]EHN58513.1 hypothetical protein OKIT_0392 [Oenococcus kitaharae DSM 17330]
MWLLITIILLVACFKLLGKLLPYLLIALVVLWLIKLWWLIVILVAGGLALAKYHK